MRQIPLTEARTILRRLAELQRAMDTGDTSALDITPLSGHRGRSRLRVGDNRVVYTTEPDADGQPIVWVWVLAAAHRREIYRNI
jgi:mRNA interferase RelE/StbE